MLEKNINKILEFIQLNSVKLPKTYIHNILNAHFVYMVATKRVTYYFESENKNKSLAYYALGLGRSSSGKDNTLGLLHDNFFNKIFSDIEKVYETSRIQIQKQIGQEAISRYPDKFQNQIRDQWEKENSPKQLSIKYDQFTLEGLKTLREQLEQYQYGATFFEQSEFMDFLKKENSFESVSLLAEIFEGNNKPKITKGGVKFKEVKGIPSIFISHSSASGMHKDKTYSQLLFSFEKYMARRTFFVFPSESEFINRKRDPDFLDKKMQSVHDIKDTKNWLNNVWENLKNNQSIKIGLEMEKYILDYEIECEDLALNKYSGHEVIKLEIENRWWKTVKLAICYQCLIDPNSNELTKQAFDIAKNYADSLGQYLIKFYFSKPDDTFDQFKKFFASNKYKKFTVMQLRKLGFLSWGSFSKDWQQHFEYLNETFKDEGLKLVEQKANKNSYIYFLTDLIQEEMEGK